MHHFLCKGRPSRLEDILTAAHRILAADTHKVSYVVQRGQVSYAQCILSSFNLRLGTRRLEAITQAPVNLPHDAREAQVKTMVRDKHTYATSQNLGRRIFVSISRSTYFRTHINSPSHGENLILLYWYCR